MTETDRCPNCGSGRASGNPGGLCPRCLLRGVLDPDGPSEHGTTAVGILETLDATVGPMPRVLLRDSETLGDLGPVVRPYSAEMPDPSDRAGRLQILGEIARGGMGAVLKGRDNDLGRDLAVKVLLDRHCANPDLLRRFVEEAQIAGQLQHPGVVPVYELGTFADRRPYFAMKLVKGRTLAEVLDGRPDPSHDLSRLLSIFLDVAQTISYAHARGVIHRDLKPSNVMVGSFGEVQVMDWGLAKLIPRGGAVDDESAGKVKGHSTIIATARSGSEADASEAGSVMGTPAYMAPEQARGENDDLDERVDVFALGSILCEILTGRPAFTGRNSGEIQRKAALGDLADASARLDACGAEAELVGLVRDCLARERGDRPGDAEAVARRVTAYLSGVQDRLRVAERDRAVAEARATEERRRRRLQVGLAASVLALTIVGGSTATILVQHRQARAAAAERILGEATTLLGLARQKPEDPFRWQTALAAVRRVEVLSGGDRSILERLGRVRSEVESGLQAAERDDVLRQVLLETRANEKVAGRDGTEEAYAEAFRSAGLDVNALTVAESTARLLGRPPMVVIELAAHLDHLSALRRLAGRPAPDWRKPLQVAQRVDPHGDRYRIRELLAAGDLQANATALHDQAKDDRPGRMEAPTAVLLAEALGEAGDAGARVDLLRKAAVHHPDDVWLNFALAEALEGLGADRREEAARYYYAARSLRPVTSLNLALLLANLGRPDEAEGIFRDLAARRPNNEWNLVCLASFLQARNRPAEATIVLQVDRPGPGARAIRMKDYVYNIAASPTLAARERRFADAQSAREALRVNPADVPAWMELGKFLLLQGDVDGAISAYREVIRLQPGDAKAHLQLGGALRVKGDVASAIVEYREAIRLQPDLPDGHFNLATTLLDAGRRDEARAEYRRALEFYPPNSVGAEEIRKRIRVIGD